MAFHKMVFHRTRLRDLHAVGLSPSAQVSILRCSDGGKTLTTEVRPLGGVSDEPSEQNSLPYTSPSPEFAEASVGFVLSSHHCRFLSVPWSDALLDDEGGAAYLRRTFVDAYGECANQWEITCPDERYGQSRVACAIDRSFLEAIRKNCAAQLTFVRPYFSAAFNRFRGQMGAAKGVFAAVEEGGVTIGRVLGGSVVEVEVLAGEADWQDALSAWLARNALLEDDLGKAFVLCPPAWQGGEGGAQWTLLQWPDEVLDLVTEHPALALPACAL